MLKRELRQCLFRLYVFVRIPAPSFHSDSTLFEYQQSVLDSGNTTLAGSILSSSVPHPKNLKGSLSQISVSYATARRSTQTQFPPQNELCDYIQAIRRSDL